MRSGSHEPRHNAGIYRQIAPGYSASTGYLQLDPTKSSTPLMQQYQSTAVTMWLVAGTSLRRHLSAQRRCTVWLAACGLQRGRDYPIHEPGHRNTHTIPEHLFLATQMQMRPSPSDSYLLRNDVTESYPLDAVL